MNLEKQLTTGNVGRSVHSEFRCAAGDGEIGCSDS